MDTERTTAGQPPDLSSEQIQISNVLFLNGTLNRLQKIVSELRVMLATSERKKTL